MAKAKKRGGGRSANKAAFCRGRKAALAAGWRARENAVGQLGDAENDFRLENVLAIGFLFSDSQLRVVDSWM